MVRCIDRGVPGSFIMVGSGNRIDTLLNGRVVDSFPTPRAYIHFDEVWGGLTKDEQTFIGLDICVGFLGKRVGTILFNFLTKKEKGRKKKRWYSLR